MYVPAHFGLKLAEAKAHIRLCDVANLVTVNAGVITANLVPVLFDDDVEGVGDQVDRSSQTGGGNGVLFGHLAKANPQWTNVDSAVEAIAILAGPDAYVSPSAYESKQQHGRVVPTWNYTTVHVYGSLTWVHDPARKLEIVTALTNRHEGRRSDPWQVTDAPVIFIDGLQEAIVGFELAITRVEGKAKLSQNRSPADRAGVAADLAGATTDNSRDLAEAMRQHRSE